MVAGGTWRGWFEARAGAGWDREWVTGTGEDKEESLSGVGELEPSAVMPRDWGGMNMSLEEAGADGPLEPLGTGQMTIYEAK